MSPQQKSGQEKFTPGFMLHLYDELTETKPNPTLKDYQAYLVLWGMKEADAKVICSHINDGKDRRLTREEVCDGLNFSPEQPAGLREVEILCRDMPFRMSESIQVIVLNALNNQSDKKDLVTLIKKEIEQVYGPKWNVFVASGHYWAMCTHKPGCNLVFQYKGVVYGVYQSPDRDFEDSPFGANCSYTACSSKL